MFTFTGPAVSYGSLTAVYGSLRYLRLSAHHIRLQPAFVSSSTSLRAVLSKLLHTSVANNMPSALIFLAEGAEEMETVITADVLRRGGLNVILAGVDGAHPVLCSRDVKIVPDKGLKEALAAGPYDVLICPGGAKGAETLCKNAEVGKALKDQENRGGFVAAVCAGPTALLAHGIGSGKKITSYPSVSDKLKDKYKYSEDRVVVDGKLITSRGPGTCFEFALAIVEHVQGKEKANALINPMLIKL